MLGRLSRRDHIYNPSAGEGVRFELGGVSLHFVLWDVPVTLLTLVGEQAEPNRGKNPSRPTFHGEADPAPPLSLVEE